MRSKSRRGIGKCVWRDIDLERSKIGRDMRTIAVYISDHYNSSSTSTSTERVKFNEGGCEIESQGGMEAQATFRYSESQLKCVTAPPQPQAGIDLYASPRLMRQKKNPPPPPTQPSESDHVQRDIRRSSTITQTAHLTHRGFRTYSLSSSTRAKTEQHMQKSTIETNMWKRRSLIVRKT
jgi:hypothetical protein